MRKLLIYCSIFVLVFLAACGVKKNAVPAEAEKASEVPLHMQIVSDSADSMQKNPTLGLLWQNDSLRIVLNQGRQLRRACNTTDTLYLYETPRDSADLATRQYALSLPMHELHIIKYNDSLVYPIMPTTEPCEYPLDIEAVGIRSSHKYYGALHEIHLPWENIPGKYQRCCKSTSNLVIDSTQSITIFLDGSWQLHANNKLLNTGIIRRHLAQDFYTIYDSNEKQLYLTDTTAMTGHIHTLFEWTQLKKQGRPLISGEFYHLETWPASYGRVVLILTPIKKDRLNCKWFMDNQYLYIEEGIIPCGWQIMRN